MNGTRTRVRRRQLDRQLLPLRASISAVVPKGGWIHAIREALGMSLDGMAKRLKLASRSTAYQLERAEADESISIKRLRAAADALGCDIAVVFLPRVPLSHMVEWRAREIAVERLQRVGHSMSLEDQDVREEDLNELIDQMAREILERGDAKLWD